MAPNVPHAQNAAATGYGWADALPQKQGLYDPANERDACGVGFIINIKGAASHSILRDSEDLLCNMSHRGATGADERDGDGAGVMAAMPHKFMVKAFGELGCVPPPPGQYATGNVFTHQDSAVRKQSTDVFDRIAVGLGLHVAAWRRVPANSEILGPIGRSREPVIMQPLVVAMAEQLSEADFQRRLFILRKRALHEIGFKSWFYVCSLATRNIVYKGLLTPAQVPEYYPDLRDADFETHFALVHSRFSTNTFPSWERAQPFNWCAHNGEINTLRGNENWMRAREGLLRSSAFGDKLQSAFPIIDEFGSDSAAFDNVLELLVVSGAMSMPEAVMVMVPEAWQNNPQMPAEKRAFYEWASCIMEPWDGPALFTFSDGRYCGASLDRNGLRPCRYYVTADDRMICASEVGTVKVDPATVLQKGRLMPGRMLLVDTRAGSIVDDEKLKLQFAQQHPYQQWIDKHQIRLEHLEPSHKPIAIDSTPISRDRRLRVFGYSAEQLNLIVGPMVQGGKEPLGSMGNDTVLACLDPSPRLPYEYFRELFAQVTNPPIDPIREKIVMSLACHVGPEANLLETSEHQVHRLALDSPVLTNGELAAIRSMADKYPDWDTRTIDTTYTATEGIDGYAPALDRVCNEAEQAIREGCKVVILSDRAVGPERVALSALLAAGAVHHHLVAAKLRAKVALLVESGEVRETHHFCVLVGYGVDAVCPYMVYEAIAKLHRERVLADKSVEKLVEQFRHAVDDGFRKVMSKMGISTLQSYKGAQIFEALGIAAEVIDRCFVGTASRVGGTTIAGFAADALARHDLAFLDKSEEDQVAPINDEGEYNWRKGGEKHVNTPGSIASLQDAVRTKNKASWQKYNQASADSIRDCTLRGLLDISYDESRAIPLDEVEPWTSIVRRFCTGAMSYGSISKEAHTALAVAMNRLGGKSNSGEGGEDPERSVPRENGDSERSAIKQIASGRFGVTSNYLSDADELQIKMAQGAKAGEGGELLGTKVSKDIAKTRHTTPGVTLVSPPPHHDIYSIEDLKQLIFDLKSANAQARVSVKLVSEVGIGVVASGVVKALADHILVAGHDGGTGAARWTGIKYAGLPWELGLAETHQTLVLNDLRGRVVLQTDGQLKTAKDVAVAAMLGAEEFGFATTPLITLGCVYLRRCHQNNCAVGVATQDPVLRAKFRGQPEHVINFFSYLAEDLREIMARLGYRTLNELVGRAEHLRVRGGYQFSKGELDLSMLLKPAHTMRPGVATFAVKKQDHQLESRLDATLLPQLIESLQTGKPAEVSADICNTDRAFGTILSYHLSRSHGLDGLPSGTVRLHLRGSAGQSLGAFLAPGIAVDLEGDANDYVGKGLSGGQLVIFPPRNSQFEAEENVIVGNVCLFGATSGEAFISGVAAERFAVRNSGALAVVEGLGDHGCEYMTGGRVVVLGKVGRNFAAGMSGGIAYVLAEGFREQCNTESVELQTVHGEEAEWLRTTIERHAALTGSPRARDVLRSFSTELPRFVKVLPTDYKRVLEEEEAAQAKAAAGDSASARSSGSDSEDTICVEAKNSGSPKPAAAAATGGGLVDIEDAMVDDTLLAERVKKLDKLRGFVTYKRRGDRYRSAKRRVGDWDEISARQTKAQLQVQAARCIDCGVPFCQSDVDGCPIGNVIPKWNELVFRDQWRDAFDRLMATNNFPEFTGRVCPAPCEGACVAGISEMPVAIKSIEAAIIDHAWERGWMAPKPPARRTGAHVAIVGSGPAGLAAADQLNSAGHLVTVFEREDRIGGLLTYGIPNMKLDKRLVQRRVDKMAAEGVVFVTGAHVGVTHAAGDMLAQHDALLLATGATWPRDLAIEGRQLGGVHFAMEYLTANTKTLLGAPAETKSSLSAAGKRVVVIGGGDTGNDCIGTAVRQGAASVVNFELLPQPPRQRASDNPWPQFPRVYRVDYGHEEVVSRWGRDPREYCVSAKRFVSNGAGNVEAIETVRVEWTKKENGQWSMAEVPGSEEVFKADLVFLAMGFLGPENKVIEELAVAQGPRSNIQTPDGSYQTSVSKVFAAGDCRRGQSLVVWGINEGRQAAREVDQFLRAGAASRLPVSGGVVPRTVSVPNADQSAVTA
ncbi:glutamate synthase [NADH] [Coemansia guatemalensis]|uniref:Glutamate synthase [NADH] n=1 Tax=Coemansia guatemalensis TaxID=2761395 RepID=A0A9W8HU97_9FUNG|nr:glutamate synthase [NADH] [Coemansia guatemalensis]